MEIKLERFEPFCHADDCGSGDMSPEIDGRYVRLSDVLSALKGLIAITDEQLTAAFDDGVMTGREQVNKEAYDNGYNDGAWAAPMKHDS